ncbi:MAG TPA: hypothetical protein VL651_12725 [Bacteroidia bacterium]|jgi:hypothetical protein|nr:hypothetical protein [Bacteroidia bacterium]
MNLPDLPTDNLYKFKAICGFVFTLVTLCALFFLLSYQTPKSEIYKSELSAINREIDISHSHCRDIDSLLTEICDSVGFKRSIGGAIIPKDSGSFRSNFYYSYVDSLERWKSRLLTRLDELSINKSKTSSCANNEESKTSFWKDNLMLIIFILLFILSFIYAINGFDEWYRHSQRYLDAILMKQCGVSEERIHAHISKIEEEEKKEAARREKRKLFWSKVVGLKSRTTK